jgi:hypothetical protein
VKWFMARKPIQCSYGRTLRCNPDSQTNVCPIFD